jgi:cation diffusion facilitator family transporter
MNRTQAEKEKLSAAMNSVGAAVALTSLKIVVGLWSGSVGILAEAAHSGLDSIAALVTYVAVRKSGQPADKEHPYGHGKIENLAALVEVVLLLATCGWIISEAVTRLGNQTVNVDASVWAFGVIVTSILVDVSRSRMLRRAAMKHRSQALEADALHFSTDIWSSAVVLVGLVGVKVGAAVPSLNFLARADAIAALLVAAIVVVVSLQLGRRTIQGLLDTAPGDLAEKVKVAVGAMPGVMDCHAVRIRHSGPRYFVDLHVLVDGSQTLGGAHELTERIEHKVQTLVPDADVTVHPEPWQSSVGSEEQGEGLKAIVR